MTRQTITHPQGVIDYLSRRPTSHDAGDWLRTVASSTGPAAPSVTSISPDTGTSSSDDITNATNICGIWYCRGRAARYNIRWLEPIGHLPERYQRPIPMAIGHSTPEP